LEEGERRQVLYGLNRSARLPVPETLHRRFRQQAAARPDAIAVSGGGQQLSFGELERRSNRLGHYLRRRGVGPEQVGGLLVERTPQAVVGMLAVLKVGGAYLPLDGGSPS